MRLLSLVLLTALIPSAARADEPPPPPTAEVTVTPEATVTVTPEEPPAAPAPVVTHPRVPFRVVKLLPATHQALLLDVAHNTHVLVTAGGPIEGYTVTEIDDDAVVLTAGAASIVLAAPDQPWRHRAHTHEQVHQAPASTPEPTVAAPASTTTAAAPVDPYEALPTPAATTSSSDVRAFPSTPAGAIREAETPVGDRALSPFADPGTATTPAPTPAPAPTTAPTTAPTPPATSPEPPKAPVQLPRADLTAALADFAALSQALRAHLTAQGAQLDAVAPTGLFQRLGLRPGDVVLAVDNLALRDLDAVAELYARAATVKAFRIQLLRAGAPVTLDIIIR